MTSPSTLTRRQFSASLAAGAGLMVGGLRSTATAFAQELPKPGFIGAVVAEWLPDGRNMKLVQPISYVSADGRKWPVPAGAVVDGASIPSVFWSLIGGPFDGPYRAPSVIHDFYCEMRTRPSADVHAVFHESMLQSGVGKSRAWMMYQAVNRFGPQWVLGKIDPRCETVDENYDYDLCQQNTKRSFAAAPAAKKVDEAALASFAEEMEGQIDDADLKALRQLQPD